MRIKHKTIKGCAKCGSIDFTSQKDLAGKSYPTTCKNCETVNRKIVNQCPYCKSKKYSKWGKEIRNFYAVECADCSLVYLKNPLNDKMQNLYYSKYATYVHQKLNIKKKQRKVMYQIELDYFIKCVNNFNKLKEVLDVGCGGGFFLDLIKKYKKKTYGLEISEDSYEIAKKKHKMYFGKFNKKIFKKKKFDLIILRGVLEHVPNPKKYIYNAQKILKKNGYVFITATPDIKSISANLFKERWTQHRPESHILHLGENHIDNLFPKRNYQKIGSKHLYLNTPYENFESDIKKIYLEIIRKEKKIKSKIISPAFFGNMMTLVFKKI